MVVFCGALGKAGLKFSGSKSHRDTEAPRKHLHRSCPAEFSHLLPSGRRGPALSGDMGDIDNDSHNEFRKCRSQ